MNKIIYTLATKAWFLLVKSVKPFNNRARQLVEGQKGLLEKYEAYRKSTSKRSLWFHVSSLGEFEQGRPIMEALKKEYPDRNLVVTFFSPSGYELKKNDPLCDAVFYLPFESKYNAKFVLTCLNPEIAVWIKYDFWYYYLRVLHKYKIPVFLCAAQFRKSQAFFKPYGRFQRKILKQFNYIFCQNQTTKDLLDSIGLTKSMVTGDNRYDRVYQTLQEAETLPLIEKFKGTDFLLIAGSSYEREERILEGVFAKLFCSFKIIFAPHFVDQAHIQSIEKRFGNISILYSQCSNETDFTGKKILIIDSIGLLANVYRYGNAAFIGGGFKHNGLHNTLEAATFGMPICFGPVVKRFPEAYDLINAGVATIVNDKNDVLNWLQKLVCDKIYCEEIAIKSRAFISVHLGATKKVVESIKAAIGNR